MFCRKSVTRLAKSSNTQVNNTKNQFGRNKSLSHWELYQLGSFVYIKITKEEQFGENEGSLTEIGTKQIQMDITCTEMDVTE